MNIALLEQYAEKLVRTPADVAKLRQMILSLAVQGKLVSDSKYEYCISETGLTVPNHWEIEQLGIVANYGVGKKVESEAIPENEWLLDLEDIEKETSILLTRKKFKDSPSLSTKTAFEKGDVLYGKLRPYLNKVLVADTNGYCTTEITAIKVSNLITPQFLALVLRSPRFVTYAISKSYGMNLPRLGTVDAKNALIPLPPFAEQERIVARVDELMGWCDRLEEQLRMREELRQQVVQAALADLQANPSAQALAALLDPRIGARASDLRQAILSLAVQGKLVAQEDGDFVHIPHTFEMKKISEVATIIRGVTFPGNEKSLNPDRDMVACLRTASVQKDIVWDGMIYIPTSYARNTEQYVKKHDIVISLANSYELVGKVALVKQLKEEAVFGAFLGVIRSINVRPEYLMIVLSSPKVQKEFRENSSQTTNIANIGVGKLKEILIPLPPLAEQERIVARVDELMALVDQLEAQQQQEAELRAQVLEAVVG